MKYAPFLLSFLIPLCVGFTAAAEDTQIYIDVGQAQVKKSLIAFPVLQYIGTQTTNATHLQAGQNLFRVMYNDLNVSNFFTFIQPSAFLEDPNKVGLKPAPGTPGGFNFTNWKTIGAEFLIRAAYQVLDKDLTMDVYVYHVPTARLVLGKSYRGSLTGYRLIAHTFSNDLVQALTGKRGMFLTKIVASRQASAAPGVKEIYVLDWDGANVNKITTHNSIAISPAWSHSGEKIAYTAFAYHKSDRVRNADMFIYDLKTGKRMLVSYRKGINSGAAFLPGDTQLLLTLSKGGSPDIYRINIDGMGLVQLTHGPSRAMNVEPAVSPDGKRIAFSSDRSGRPNIYVMDIDGGSPKRLTFAGKYNASPSWSPDGKTLAFAGYDVDHFDIFTISADGSGLKRLTDARKPNGKAANNESPSWSPDGRQILFSSDRSGRSQLYLVSPDGTSERRITEDNHNWDKPKWSPFLD
jgi:TolB protein